MRVFEAPPMLPTANASLFHLSPFLMNMSPSPPQMNWCPDAFTLNADGLVEGIFGTTAEMLSQVNTALL